MADLLTYQPSANAVYYRPAAGVAWRRTAVGLAVGVASAALVGVAYGRELPAVRELYPRLAFVGGNALVVGLLGLIPVRVGRVRSPVVACGLGAVVALVALYAMWIAWVYGALSRLAAPVPALTLIGHPIVVARLVRVIAGLGTWSYRNDVIRGPALVALWAVEAGLTLAAGTLFSAKAAYRGDAPACPACGKRCVRVPNLPRFAGDCQAVAVAAVEGRTFDVLVDLPPAAHEDAPELSLRLMSCPGCGQTHVLTLNRIAWHRGGAHPVVKTTPIVDGLLVTPAEAGRLRAACQAARQRRDQPATPPAPAVTALPVTEDGRQEPPI